MSDELPFDYSGTELASLAAANNYYRWILGQFQPYLGPTVAEIGAGIGSVSKRLLETPLEKLYAFEPSGNMFPLLRDELAHDPRVEPINDVLNPSRLPDGVDSLVYLNVLEHIEDDAAELKLAFDVLRPRGHLLVFSPALSWLFSDFDRHVGHYRRYTKRELVDKARQAGFRVVTARYFDIAGIVPWYISFVLLKSRPRPASVALFDKLIVPPMRVLESIVPPPIGKNVLLVATKD